MEQPLPLPNNNKASSFCPFSMEIEHLDRMINMEFVNHPVYAGMEIQGHDDQRSGKGLLVFLQRKQDNLFDVYYEHSLHLRSSWKKLFTLGKGLGVWKQQHFEIANLDISIETGVHAEVLFRDMEGRPIHVQIDDDTPFDPTQRSSSMTKGFLAPVGATIDHPSSLPLIYMKQLDLVRRTGQAPVVDIDQQAVTIGRMPLEQCLFGTRLIKLATDLVVVRINPDLDSEADSVDADDDDPKSEKTVSSIHRDEHGCVRAITAQSHGHRVSFSFDPPFPDPTHFDDNDEDGTWQVEIDGDRMVSGIWQCDVSAHQQQDITKAKIHLTCTRGWRPVGLPWMMKILFTIVPIFKTWPETYSWVASLQWNTADAAKGDAAPDMLSQWERTSGDRGESYAFLSGGGGGGRGK
jgi:hypothetical protein